MIRHLTDAPASWDRSQLLAAAQTIWPAAIDVNDVGGQVAVYLPTDPTADEVAAWDAAVAAHVPAPQEDPTAAALAAAEQARAEVAGFAPTNGTRQAVEALATAVETLAQGA